MSTSGGNFVRPSKVVPDGRMIRLLARMVLLGMLIAAAVVGTYWASLTLQTTQAFALEEIKTAGNVRASRNEVLRYLDVQRGENIFAANLDILRSNLLRHPWVKDAAVRRIVPNTLEVEVTEHVPAGI